jgi:outer membrane autotransporter protein
LLAVPGILLMSAAAAETGTHWVGGLGPWDRDANWDNSVPDTGVDATIANGGGAFISAPDARAASVRVREGNLATLNGGRLDSSGDSSLATAGGRAIVNINGPGSRWTVAGDLAVGQSGQGLAQLGVADGGRFEAARIETNAEEATIIIGTSREAAPGMIAADEIYGGDASGSTEVTFWHSDDDYFFTDDGTAAGDATAINGNVEVVVRSGRTTLVGEHGYTQGTSIKLGTLAVSDDASLGTATGPLQFDGGTLETTESFSMQRPTEFRARGATIDVAEDTTLTHEGAISGFSSLTKAGAGTLVLGGDNDYANIVSTGPQTLITDGTLSVAEDGHLGDAAGRLKLDGGTLRTTGTFTTARATTLAAAASGIEVAAGTTLTHNGTLSGPGGFTKSGAGTLMLEATNDYTGATRVDAGRLAVNGSNPGSAVTVARGAALGGGGTVGSTTIGTGATLAPGHSIGTLGVDGDITFAPGSIYSVETDAAGSGDRTEATGTASIDGGTVAVMARNGDYADETEYTILRADEGVSGTFDDTTTNLAFLDPTLAYGANEITLTLTRNQVDYASIAQTPNQQAVADALTAAAEGGGDGADTLSASIDALDAAGARAAYDNLSGMQHTHAPGAARQQSQRFMGLIRDRLGPGAAAGATRGRAPVRLAFSSEDWGRMLAAGAASAPAASARAGDGPGVWVRALGGNGEVDATANATGADYTSAGLAIGADTRLDNGVVVGLAAGYGHTDSDTGAGDLDTDSYQIAGYAQWREDGTYVDTRIGLGRHRTDAARRVLATGAPRTATADYDADQITWSFEGGHAWHEWNGATVTPFAGLDFNRNEREAFRERGAGAANLNVDEETLTSLRTRLGARVTGAFNTGAGATVEPRLELAWVREHADREAAITAHFDAAPASAFTAEGPELDRDRAALGLGVTATLDDSSRLDVEYRGDFADSDRHHGIALSWRTRW